MLDTTTTEAHDLIAAGYAEPVSSLAHQLALLANELRHERDQAEQRADEALKQRDARQGLLDTTFARLAKQLPELAADNATEQFLADARGPYVGTDSVFDRDGWEQLKADVLADEGDCDVEDQAYFDTDRSLGLEYAGAL